MGSGWLRPLLVWSCRYGYLLDGGIEVSNEFMGDAYDGDSKRRELASDATIRDYFAVSTLIGAQSNPELNHWKVENHAKYAYEMADAMLKARNQ